MRITSLLATVLAIASFPASAKELDDLANQLQAAKSSKTVALSSCPRSMDSLIGLTQDEITSKLGAPDLDERGKHVDGQEIAVQQYFFAPPAANWIGTAVSAGGWTAVKPLGTPFTVVQFHYNAARAVISARCYDQA